MNLKKYEAVDSDLLDHILDNITSAVFLINEDAQIQACNKAFQRLFHNDKEEIAGALFGNIIKCHFTEEEYECGTLPQCRVCLFRKSILKTIIKRENLENFVFTHEIFENGVRTTKYFKISTRPIDYEEATLALVIMDDITELEMQKSQLEIQNRKLQEMNEIKNRFLGIAAHDLRNPLAAIQGCSTIMSRTLDHGTREEMIQLIDIIQEKSQFSLSLINDLLDIAKIESGLVDLDLQENDYAALIRESSRIYKLLANSKNIELALKVQEDLPSFKFDRVKIERALNNLIDNAMKYSAEGSQVTIEAYKEKDYIVTKVIDQGYGIPENELQKIFIPFHRTNIEHNIRHKSTGLGLSIVKRIIEDHKGEIKVESAVGRGSVFTYYLPLFR